MLSTGEITLEIKLSEARQAMRPGMDVRFVNIPAEPENGFGIFENLHDFSSGHELSEAIADSCSNYYGTPIREFLEKIVALNSKAGNEFISEISKAQIEFQNSLLANHNDKDGQVKRVAKRFSLVASAGELAIGLGILPLHEGAAFEACSKCFKDWLNIRGSTGSLEVEKAIEQLRHYLDSLGAIKFVTLNSDGSIDRNYYPIKERMGFRELIENEYHYYFPTDSFKQLSQKWGINKDTLAQELFKRNYLAKDHKGDNPLKKFPYEKKRRVYHIKPTIFEEE